MMQSHTTLRSLVLAVTSLVAVVVVFAIYRSTHPGSSNSGLNQPSPENQSSPPPSPVATQQKSNSPEDSGEDSNPEVAKAESKLHMGNAEIPITGGSKVSISLYDQDGKKRGRLNADEWKPLPGNRFEITKPVIHLRTPNGQTVRVSADHGHVQLKGNDPRRPDPKRGTLSGNVQIIVDRLSDEQRDLLPPDERYKINDERQVKIDMEDVTFDLEYARIQTERSFSIESIEARLAGVGLLLHYNELDSRIEELVVREGREIEVIGFGESVGLAGDSKSDNAGSVKDPAVKADQPENTRTEPLASANTNGADDSDLPIVEIVSTDDEPRSKPVDEYTAVFEGDVHIRRLVDAKQTGQLLADRLEILFDFGAQERELAKQPRGKRSEVLPPDAENSEHVTNGDDARSKSPIEKATGAADLPVKPDERIRLTWTGPLRVISQRRAQAEDPDTRRMHILATGDKVEVRDEQRTAICNKLIYQDETGLVELYGTPEQPAFVEVDGTSSLSGTEIKLDRTKGNAFAKGPGRLVSSRSPGLGEQDSNTTAGVFDPAHSASGSVTEQFEVSFGGDVNATFGKTPVERIDPETGELKTQSIQTLHRAHFTGGVDMRQGGQRIQCDRIDIDFALNEQGEIYPIRVHAIEDVTVSQGERYIKAANELIADFHSYQVPKPPFDLQKAREIVIERGLDPNKQDWGKIEKDYTAKRKYRTGLSNIFADGTVVLRDPSQELEVDCGKLTCKFTESQEIESGVVTPKLGQDAFVGLGEFSIASPADIKFSAARQSAKVDGAGKMTFLADRDFDGRELDSPTLVRIMWQQRMEFEGQKNVANFWKKVHVSTDSSTYDCDQLRVDFVDAVKASPGQPAGQTEARGSKWWIFTPLVDSVTGQSREQSRFKISGPSFNKDPIFVQATGHVIGVNRNFREGSKRLKSRVQMKGPSMSIDLQKKFVRIDGKGNMLIEDYKPPKASHASQASSQQPKNPARATPFGGASRNEPSQTYLGWGSTMHYQYESNIAQLNKDVQLVHRSGGKMKMAVEILGQREAASLSEGRIATLDAQSLVVQFLRSSKDKQVGAGRLSGTEVQSFNASGQVYFVDSGISALAQQITFSRDDNILQIIGSKDDPAQLFDERGDFRSMTGPRFEWDRRTNIVRAQNSYGRMN